MCGSFRAPWAVDRRNRFACRWPHSARRRRLQSFRVLKSSLKRSEIGCAAGVSAYRTAYQPPEGSAALVRPRCRSRGTARRRCAHHVLPFDTIMRVGFFVTCLVDLVRPAVGFAAIKLLKMGGADVYVPPMQTCCGQPAYNSGDRSDAIALARKVVDEFENFDYLVAPSGSCSGMIKTHYRDLFRGDAAME